MDVVYLCRSGESNDELRYSLRSLSHLAVDTVYLAGCGPGWLRNVNLLTNPPQSSKYRHVESSLMMALDSDEVSDPFYLFNDDFYIMQPTDSIPLIHRGTMLSAIEGMSRLPKGSRYRAHQQMYAYLQSMMIEQPYCYETHAPMPIEKDTMRAVLRKNDSLQMGVFLFRTMYGNYIGSGVEGRNYKLYTGGLNSNQNTDYVDWPYLSTSGHSWIRHKGAEYIRSVFSTPSRYE